MNTLRKNVEKDIDKEKSLKENINVINFTKYAVIEHNNEWKMVGGSNKLFMQEKASLERNRIKEIKN